MMTIRDFNWGHGVFLIGYHLALVLLLPWYLFHTGAPALGLLVSSFILFGLTGLSITAGYHRCFSHRSYEAGWTMKSILVFLGTLATQGSVLKWTHDHRLHHRFVDTNRDPYSINKGFWYAHCLWLFEERKPFDRRVVRDLLQDRLLVFQDRYYDLLVFGSNAIVVLSLGWIWNDYFGAFVFAFLARLFLLHHATWSINSLAHFWGVQPYSKEHSAVNNFLIALLTFGEGYHNYHHTFPGDYRNGFRWFQFDPSKFLIWICGKTGLAKSLRSASRFSIQRKLLSEDRRLVLEKLAEIGDPISEVLESRIHQAYERLASHLREFESLRRRYLHARRSSEPPLPRRPARSEIKAAKKAMRKGWVAWVRLCDEILSLKPSTHSLLT